MRLIQTIILTISFLFISLTASAQYPFGSKLTWDKYSLSIDGKRVCPVMGEVHYSRIPENEWEAEVKKMKEGGVTIIATYVFWNHVEEQEGVFDWSGQRNLRRFIEVCKAEGMPVVLRVGPFCHGEVRLGGIPDWMFTKKSANGNALRMRSEDPVFLSFVERLYRQIFTQIQGLQWKDGGPIMACQFDNEYRGRGSYLMALKRIALGIGYDLPFYTRTGWPELATPVPFGEMLPLYGDYADGFWERSTAETAGSYWKAFHFKGQRTTDAIASEQIDYSNTKANANEQQYPYFTCELGGGMMTSYHRRVYLYPEDAYSMALVKLGSGSNLLGYYMYHGGTNPVSWAERLGKSEAEGKYLNEMQRTIATNYNDLPVKTYDFQAPLGEFGQRNPHFFSLRPLHLFMQDFGDLLAPMEAIFPCADKEQKKGDNSYLRWSYRVNGQGDDSCPAFVFLNNYERLQNLTAKKNVQFNVCGVKFPKKAITIPAGAMAIFPVNIDIDGTHIDYATAQLVAHRDGKIYMMQIPGIPTEISVNGKVLKNVKAKGIDSPIFKNIYLFTPEQAGLLFLDYTDFEDVAFSTSITKLKEAGAPRTITIGVNKAAEEPTDADFEQAAVYQINVPEEARRGFHRLLSIDYRGDVARLYADGQLIQDNFYNGRPMLYGLWRLPAGTKQLELRILPLQKDMPIYFPREADTTLVKNSTLLKSYQTYETNLILATFLLAPLFSLFSLHAQQVIDLAGVWSFAMNDQPVYDDYVMLPGSMLTNDKGNDVNVNTPWTGSLYDSSYYFNPYMEKYRKEGEMKFPFFLTPEKHYVGNAWYKRQFYVPQNWEGQRIRLFLERPHIETTVFINGQEVGHQMSLSTPHVYDVTKYVKVGSSNIVAIKVYNGIENVCVGQDSHSVTDQTQGNWNGIAGRIELQANPKKLNIKHVKVVPDVKKKMAYITVKLENHVDGVRFMPKTFYYVHAEAVAINSKTNTNPISSTHVEALSNTIHLTLNFGKRMQTWDEFSPVVYALTVYAGDDVYETQFGMRDISIDGRQFYMNGHPIWFRGTVENCCFPETGYPPTDEESWMKIFKKCREYGINHMRFHSYCPPEAAFAAADIMGMYLQPEGPSWPNHGVRLNRGMNIDKYLLEESKRIIDTYGNHPSFVMMAAGNEPAGDWVTYCNNWVKEMKKYDPSRVYCGASVGGGWAWDDGSEYHVKGGARGLDWDRQAPQSTDNYFDQILHPRNFKPASDATESVNTHPIIAHEQGQWCAFPDFKEIHQYDGVYKARNFEIFRDLLADNGMASQADNFLMASGKLQTLCYKYEIERNLRTKEYAGFQLLSLNDYSGQGTALVGPLNVFWKEKGYVNGNQWREFCNPLVILASFPKFVFTNDETPKIPISIYNAYSSAVSPEKIQYMIFSEDSLILADGTLESKTIPLGKDFLLGSIQCNFSQIEKPSKFTLLVNIDNTIVNHWDFWVYPKEMPNLKIKDKDIYITDTLDEKAMKTLRKGGNVLLTAAGKVKFGQDVKQTYLPVFWNTSWFKMRPPHTTGAYIDAQHPLFKEFPTDNWSNLNWWELLNKAQVMNLSELPASYQPPIQPIDTWHVSRKLGMLIEAKVLKGKLLMTTMDITNRLDQRVVARQMRHAILSYMNSDAFSPTLTLTPELITDFFEKEAPAVNMFTKDSPDELKPKLK